MKGVTTSGAAAAAALFALLPLLATAHPHHHHHHDPHKPHSATTTGTVRKSLNFGPQHAHARYDVPISPKLELASVKEKRAPAPAAATASDNTARVNADAREVAVRVLDAHVLSSSSSHRGGVADESEGRGEGVEYYIRDDVSVFLVVSLGSLGFWRAPSLLSPVIFFSPLARPCLPVARLAPLTPTNGLPPVSLPVLWERC